jgi:Arc/MetJ-type ribon-helix-helix transcriptional regulator
MAVFDESISVAMNGNPRLDADTEAASNGLVESGRYGSREQVLREAFASLTGWRLHMLSTVPETWKRC